MPNPVEPNWEAFAPGKPLLALDTGGHSNAVYKVMLNQYGDQLISVGLDKTIRVWDVHTGESPCECCARRLVPAHLAICLQRHVCRPMARPLAVSGYRALTPLHDHRIMLISLADGRMLHSLKGHRYAIYDLAFSPDGKRLASASHDSTLRIWDAETGSSVQTLKGHTDIVHGVAWSPDGKRVVSGSTDRTARIWNVEKGTVDAVLAGHTDEPPTRGLESRWPHHCDRLQRPSGPSVRALGKIPL